MRATWVSIIATIAAGLCFAANPQSDPAEDFATSAYDEAGSGKHCFLALPVVQADLALSADQVAKLLPWLKAAEKSYFREDASPAARADELLVETTLKEILSEDQQRRLGQIMLQATFNEPLPIECVQMPVHCRLHQALQVSAEQRVEIGMVSLEVEEVMMDLWAPILARAPPLTEEQVRDECRACYPEIRKSRAAARHKVSETILTQAQRKAINEVVGRRIDLDVLGEQYFFEAVNRKAEPGVGADSR